MHRDRVVVVTGAARGLGRRFAHRFAESGAAVAVVDLDLHSYRRFDGEAALMTADTTDAELRGLGRESRGYEVDLTDRAGTAAVLDRIAADFGRIDALVCNAGGGFGGVHEHRASELDLESLDLAIARNLHTAVNTCVAAAPHLRAAGAGSSVVMISSINGDGPTDDGAYSHYGVAKAGVGMYARYLARDLGADGIRVNTVSPSTVPTARLVEAWAASGAQPDPSSSALGRAPTLDEIADVVLFLSSEGAGFVTGQTITVDGGGVRR